MSAHIFLQGPRNIGKSTVITKTLDILNAHRAIILGGFFTWNGGHGDPHVYMRPALPEPEGERYRLASYDTDKGGLICDIQAFEKSGAELLKRSRNADLIIMDELGFLENDAAEFKRAVLDIISGDIPVLGVLRLGDVPWHKDIKSNPRVTIFEVNEKNRDTLPRELAALLMRTGH